MRLIQFHTYTLDGYGAQTQYPVKASSGLIPLYGGGFDSLGGAINLQPRQVAYHFDITQDDAYTIREKVDLFQAAMMHGRGLLRAINRDDVRVQTWAKVTSIDLVREPGGAGYQAIDVTFEMAYPYWLNSADEPNSLDDQVLVQYYRKAWRRFGH